MAQSPNVGNPFLPKLLQARASGTIEEYIFTKLKPKKQLKEIKQVLLPEKKKFLFLKYGKKFNLKDRCVVCGMHQIWEAGDFLRPPIPLDDVTKGRPLRGTYCPKHASTHMQLEMLQQQILASQHGLDFKAFKPRMPKVMQRGLIKSLTKEEVFSLTATGWLIKPPAFKGVEGEVQEVGRLIGEISLATERLNYIVGITKGEVIKEVKRNGTDKDTTISD